MRDEDPTYFARTILGYEEKMPGVEDFRYECRAECWSWAGDVRSRAPVGCCWLLSNGGPHQNNGRGAKTYERRFSWRRVCKNKNQHRRSAQLTLFQRREQKLKLSIQGKFVQKVGWEHCAIPKSSRRSVEDPDPDQGPKSRRWGSLAFVSDSGPVTDPCTCFKSGSSRRWRHAETSIWRSSPIPVPNFSVPGGRRFGPRSNQQANQ